MLHKKTILSPPWVAYGDYQGENANHPHRGRDFGQNQGGRKNYHNHRTSIIVSAWFGRQGAVYERRKNRA